MRSLNENLDEDEDEEEENMQNSIQEPEKIIPPTFYEKVGDNITLDLSKLIDLVISRYKLLKDVESLSSNKYRLYNIISKKIPISLTWANEETINNDIASHFLLGLIMVKNDKDLRWFITQESLLYYSRIRKTKYNKPEYDMYKILILLGLKLNIFDENDNDDNIDINKIKFRRKINNNEKIYYIDFIDGINLLPSRAYYLHKGNLYILEYDLPQLFIRVFQKKQESILSKIKSNLENFKKDHRIREIMNSFEKEKEKFSFQENKRISNYLNNNQKLKTMKDVDKYSEKCFPLCMCLIQRHLNKYSHLMHFGRLQYTLFLKSAGLPLEEAINLFRKKFEPKVRRDKFDRQYLYYIRHAYGQEGKMRNYFPYNCDKILEINPPMGHECHGCPFKTKSSEDLRSLLTTCNLRDIDIEDILNSKKCGAYQFCCVKYFQGKFIGERGEGIGVHPTAFFNSAMKILKGENNKNNNNMNNNMNNNTINNINSNVKDNDKKENDKNNIIINEDNKSQENSEDVNMDREGEIEGNEGDEDDDFGINLDDLDKMEDF